MSNGMKESQDGEAFLEHVDVGTFARFAEYVHSGDYSAAAPVEVVREPEECVPEPPGDYEEYSVPADYPNPDDETPAPVEEPAVPPPEPEVPIDVPASADGWGDWSAQLKSIKKKGKKKKTCKQCPLVSTGHAAHSEEDRLVEEPIPAEEPIPQPFPIDPTPGPNVYLSTSHTSTFASHVAVYHFAQQYLVPGLKKLSGQKLSDALNVFHCYHECVVDICDTVRLIYDPEYDSQHPSALHETISEYATNNFRELMNSILFKSLLTEGGEFPADLCSKVARLL